MFGNLEVHVESGWAFVTFTDADGRRVRRLIMPAAVDAAREIAESGDPYKIDSFCYRVY